MKILKFLVVLLLATLNLNSLASNPVTNISGPVVISPKKILEIINVYNIENKTEKNSISIQEGKLLSSKGAFDFLLEGGWKSIDSSKEYGELNTSLTYPTPYLGVEVWGGYRKTNGSIPSYWDYGSTTDNGQITIGASIPLLQGLLIDRRRANFWQNELLFEAKKNDYEQKYIDIALKGLSLYFNWSIAEKRLQVAKQLLSIAEKRGEWLSISSQAGSIALFDKEDNDRTILNRKSSFIDLQLKYHQSWQALVLFLNAFELLPGAAEAYTSSNVLDDLNFIIPDYESWKQKALEQRKDLIAMDEIIAEKKVSIDLFRQEYLPKLKLKGEVAQNQGAITIENEEDYRVMINFEMPLQLREARGKYLQANSEFQNAQLRKQFLEQKIQNDIKINIMNLEALKERLSITKKELSLAEKLESGEQKRFKFGDSSLVIVNIREQTTAETHIKYQELLVDFWRTKVELYSLSGELPSF
ncbi:MAG: TolC family protein [Bacteriovoracaceae bacterium]|nr:TolC family protein [Bacteriovoracaceae bacterium]